MVPTFQFRSMMLPLRSEEWITDEIAAEARRIGGPIFDLCRRLNAAAKTLTPDMPEAEQTARLDAAAGPTTPEGTIASHATEALYSGQIALSQALLREWVAVATEAFATPGAFDFVKTARLVDRDFEAAAKAMGLPPTRADTSFAEFWHYATWRLAGRQIYDPSPGLAERLAATNVRGLQTDDLRLPYPAFYLAVPKRLGLKVYNSASGDHTLRGIYVVETNDVLAHGVRTRGWRIMLWGEPKPIAGDMVGLMPPGSDEFNDALFYFSLVLAPGLALDAALDQMDVHVQREATDASNPANADPKTREYLRAIWRPIFRWIMNVVLYATTPDAETDLFIPDAEARRLWEKHSRSPKGSRRRREALDRFRDLPLRRSQRICTLGRGVHVLSEPGDGSGVPLTVRTLVEGHYQHYWIGAGRTQRVLRWRQPFWRGPEDGLISQPIHRLVPPPPTSGEESP